MSDAIKQNEQIYDRLWARLPIPSHSEWPIWPELEKEIHGSARLLEMGAGVLPRIPSIETTEHAPVASIQVPPEAESLLVGDVRFSPDASRVAFALALGVPDAEQGWAAVSDGLGTTAHLIATADAGTLFHVMAWLDGDTVVLQGLGTNPGVYLAKADGSVPAQRVGDGYFLGVIDNVAGQP